MKPIFVLLLVLISLHTFTADAKDVPKFKDYPSSRTYNGPVAKLKFDTEEEREFADQIRSGAAQPVNFGGEYIITSWKTGPQAIYGAVISVRTGDVVLWPYPICCWSRGDKPFYIRKDSLLVVFNGLLTEDGPGGVHYFEFRNGKFRVISSPDVQAIAPIEPSGGPSTAEDLKEDKSAFRPDPSTKLQFAKYLLGAIVRASFEEHSEILAAKLPPDMMQRYAGALLSTSVRNSILVGKIRYDLLYNSLTDVFIVAKYNDGKIAEFGMVSGKKVSEDVYGVPDEENYFNLMLRQRPQLFKRLAADFRNGQSPDKLFSQYIFDEAESHRLKANLLAGLEFIAFAAEDRCKQTALEYLKNHKITYGGVVSTHDIQIAMGLRSPDGVVLGFADRASNRRFGYFLYDKLDLSCKPLRIFTSTY